MRFATIGHLASCGLCESALWLGIRDWEVFRAACEPVRLGDKFGGLNMKTVRVIGLGDMGSGLAKNLIKGGFHVMGMDLKPDRLAAFEEMGGQVAASYAEVGQTSLHIQFGFPMTQ